MRRVSKPLTLSVNIYFKTVIVTLTLILLCRCIANCYRFLILTFPCVLLSGCRIPPDLRATVYCVAVQRGGIREWDFMRRQYERTYGDVFTALQKSAVEGALSCPTMSHVIRKSVLLPFQIHSWMVTCQAVSHEIDRIETSLTGCRLWLGYIFDWVTSLTSKFQKG